jgi:hypothetical protein
VLVRRGDGGGNGGVHGGCNSEVILAPCKRSYFARHYG